MNGLYQLAILFAYDLYQVLRRLLLTLLLFVAMPFLVVPLMAGISFGWSFDVVQRETIWVGDATLGPVLEPHDIRLGDVADVGPEDTLVTLPADPATMAWHVRSPRANDAADAQKRIARVVRVLRHERALTDGDRDRLARPASSQEVRARLTAAVSDVWGLMRAFVFGFVGNLAFLLGSRSAERRDEGMWGLVRFEVPWWPLWLWTAVDAAQPLVGVVVLGVPVVVLAPDVAIAAVLGFLFWWALGGVHGGVARTHPSRMLDLLRLGVLPVGVLAVLLLPASWTVWAAWTPGWGLVWHGGWIVLAWQGCWVVIALVVSGWAYQQHEPLWQAMRREVA